MACPAVASAAVVAMAWHFGLVTMRGRCKTAKWPRRCPWSSLRGLGTPLQLLPWVWARLEILASTRPRRASAIAAAKRGRSFVNHGAEQRLIALRTFRKHTPSCVSNGARLSDCELKIDAALALPQNARRSLPGLASGRPRHARATAAAAMAETPRATRPQTIVSPRAPPRRRKVPRRSESGTRRRTRPAGDAARSPSTCRRRCAPRAATRAPRCAGLTGPRKRCGGARTARAACAT